MSKLGFYARAVLHGAPMMLGFLVGCALRRVLDGWMLSRFYLDHVDQRALEARHELWPK